MNKTEQLWKSLKDPEYRRAFVEDDTGLAFQIKLLREKNGWTQEQLAQKAGKKQETISQWESPNYGSYNLKTLKELAKAFDVGLVVRFAPFSELVKWNVNLTPERLAPPSFEEDKPISNASQSYMTTVVTTGIPLWTGEVSDIVGGHHAFTIDRGRVFGVDTTPFLITGSVGFELPSEPKEKPEEARYALAA